MRQTRSVLTCMGLLALSAAARADDNALLELSLEELLKVEVRVASRNAEPAWLAPASVSVLTQAEIRRLGLRSLSELLNQVPGVQAIFEATEGRDSLVQGRGNPESYGQSFLLLLDGHRLNEHYTGGFTLANRFVSLGNVERVEVIRGPGSALYGGNAFSGVINIITSRQRRDVELGIGSHQGRHLSANLSEAGEDWQFAAFVDTQTDAGERYAGVFDRFGLQDSTRDPREFHDAYVNARRGRFSLRGRYTYHRLNDYYAFRRLADGTSEDVSSQAFLEAGYHWQASPALDANFTLSRSRTRWEPFARLALQGPDFPQADLLQGPRLDYRQWQAAADFAYTRSDEHRLNFGALLEYADIPVASERTNYDLIDGHYLGGVIEQSDPNYRFVEDRTRRVQALYLQDQYRFNEHWHLTGGLRYDRYNDIGGSLSPRLGLVYTPDGSTTWKLLYGEGFRAPGLGDLYDREAGQTLGNPDLGPITNQSLELAWHHQGGRWQAGMTLFATRASNLLSSVALADGRSRVENVGHNANHGFELEFAAELGEHFQLKAHYTRVLDNRTEDIPDPSTLLAEQLAAKAFGALSLNYRSGRWNHSLNGFWRAELPILAGKGDYHPLNLVSTWTQSQRLQWQLGVYNLNDQRGYAVARGSGLGRQNGRIVRALPLRGRELWLGATLSF